MSQKSYGFLITEELVIRLPNFEYFYQFSGSLIHVFFEKLNNELP